MYHFLDVRGSLECSLKVLLIAQYSYYSFYATTTICELVNISHYKILYSHVLNTYIEYDNSLEFNFSVSTLYPLISI